MGHRVQQQKGLHLGHNQIELDKRSGFILKTKVGPRFNKCAFRLVGDKKNLHFVEKNVGSTILFMYFLILFLDFIALIILTNFYFYL